MTDLSPLAATRRAWHGVAELVLAGPQDRQSHSIKLRIAPGGFATTKDPSLTVSHGALVAGATEAALDGQTCAELGRLIGVPAGIAVDRYHDGSGVTPDEVLHLDPDAVEVLAAAFSTGDAALRAFAPGETPVLWPEHFDVAITYGEVNYGVSPGDGYLDEPYAYVGPFTPREGAFWNAPFGAARPLSRLSTVDSVISFFTEGQLLAV